MPTYRHGVPGQDCIATVRFAEGAGIPKRCMAPRFREDNPRLGDICGRMATKLCDGPGCDIPICTMHTTEHESKPNTDYCPEHKDLATK